MTSQDTEQHVRTGMEATTGAALSVRVAGMEGRDGWQPGGSKGANPERLARGLG